MLHVFVRDDLTIVATHDVGQNIALSTYAAQGATRVLTLPGDDVVLAESGEMHLSETWTDYLPDAIKGEVSRRINAVLKDLKTQTNMVGAAVALSRKEAAGTITPGETATLELLQDGQDWVRAMQAAGRSLIAAGDTTFAEYSHWPAPPGGLAALAGEY